jgi:hypothetical protein
MAPALRTPAGTAVLLLLAAAASGAPTRFPVYGPCSRDDGDGTDVGLCRRRAAPARGPAPGGLHAAAGAEAKVRTFPIDMRLPCENASTPCYEVGSPPSPWG